MAAIFGRNRRSHPRQAVRVMAGSIFSSDNKLISDCNVRDISPIGARILLNEKRILPKFVYMLDARSQAHRYAEVIRQNANEVGLRFCDEPRAS